MNQKCRKCNEEKPLEEFVKDNRRSCGYGTLCKKCKRKESNERYQKIKNDPEFHSKKLQSNKKYKENNKEKVKEAWTEYNNRPEIIDRKSNWSRDKRYMTINGRLQQLLSGARSRALEGNYPFNLNLEDIYPEKFCPILGIELKWIGNGARNIDSPSLDKIIPELGYVKGNVRTISWLANLMKSNASYEQLELFSKNILKYMNTNYEDIVRTIEKFEESIELEDKELLG